MKNLLLLLSKSNAKQGFTLIELLVVIIIIGILSAVALPNLLGQVGRAREAEAKGMLGTISKSQQTYHFEQQTFADSVQQLGVRINADFYSYPDPDPNDVDNSRVKHQATALDPTGDRVRNYALGVYYDSGAYQAAVCESKDINESVQVGNNYNDNCTNDGVKLN